MKSLSGWVNSQFSRLVVATKIVSRWLYLLPFIAEFPPDFHARVCVHTDGILGRCFIVSLVSTLKNDRTFVRANCSLQTVCDQPQQWRLRWLGLWIYISLVGHVSHVWDDGRALFDVGSYTFFSIFEAVANFLRSAPTAGGQYHWVAILAPRSMKNFLSYLIGTC